MRTPFFVESLEPRQLLAAAQPLRAAEDYRSESLTAREVQGLLAQATSQALPTQIVVITDREGVILGSFRMRRADNDAPTREGRKAFRRVLSKATARARTAALF